MVDGKDQFSFRGIPYAVPPTGPNRFTHSRAATSLLECHEGTFLAHDVIPEEEEEDDAAALDNAALAANSTTNGTSTSESPLEVEETTAVPVATEPINRKCWRKYPDGSSRGHEDCLTVDIYTSNVVYNELMPVVVYVEGDDLYEDVEETMKPSSGRTIKNSATSTTIISSIRKAIYGLLLN